MVAALDDPTMAALRPTLESALAALARERPADPVSWLANYLLSHKPAPATGPAVLCFLSSGEPSEAACLANGYASAFTDADQQATFASVEQYMMHAKAVMFPENEALQQKILETTDYDAIKAMGRQVKNFDGAAWGAVARDVVVKACTLKFGSSPDLRAYLLSTGSMHLGQLNGTEKRWGLGVATAEEAHKLTPAAWPGDNLLGDILMEVRASLQ